MHRFVYIDLCSAYDLMLGSLRVGDGCRAGDGRDSVVRGSEGPGVDEGDLGGEHSRDEVELSSFLLFLFRF